MLNIVQDPATHKYAERLAQSFDAARMKEQLTQAMCVTQRLSSALIVAALLRCHCCGLFVV